MKQLCILLSLLLVIALTVSCASDDNQTQESSNVTSGQNTEVKEENMENLMRELVQKNYVCITELFYFGNLPYENTEIDGVDEVAKVQSNKYQSLDDVRSFLNEVYVADEVERLISNYFDGRPLYFEKNGSLYLYVSQTTSAGIPLPWDSFEINIVSSSEDYCSFEAIVKYVDGVGENNIFNFEAKNENGWKLVSVVKNPQ